MAEGGHNSFSSGSEIVFDFFCELCFDDNKQVEAEGYCVDCSEYLCGYCYNGHRRSRPTRHHVLQDKINMPKDTPLSTDRVSKDIATKCKVHSGKPVEYFCSTHATLGCANCFATDHRTCADVESVAHTSEYILESQFYHDFKSKLELIRKKSSDIEERARENKTVLQSCYTDLVSSVRQLKEEVIVILNEYEQTVVTRAEKMIADGEEKMEFVVEDCQVLSEKIKGISSEFELLQSSKRVCQLYINMRETEGEVQTIHENLGKLDEANVVRTFTFEPNAGLTSLLRSHDILGTISHQYQQTSISIPVTEKRPISIKATQLANVRVRSRSDSSKCYISGSAMISSDRLVITDWNNNKVKLIDINTNMLQSELTLSSRPWDITVLNRTEAAVTLPYSNTIIFVQVSPSLTQNEEITVRGECRGIAYSQDKLLVTYEDNPRLDIIDLHGNVIRTMENDGDGSTLFTSPWYVCVSRDNATIYVSDCGRDAVTSLTWDGVVNAVYKDRELNCPYKVCTDHHGNVHVCSDCRNVHIITADCKKIKVILTQTDGLYSDVVSVIHCQDTNKLFVGMGADEVNVYQLS